MRTTNPPARSKKRESGRIPPGKSMVEAGIGRRARSVRKVRRIFRDNNNHAESDSSEMTENGVPREKCGQKTVPAGKIGQREKTGHNEKTGRNETHVQSR